MIRLKDHFTDSSSLGIKLCLLQIMSVSERTILTVLKSILSNTFHRREGCNRPEDVKIKFFCLQHDRNLLGVGKRYSKMTSGKTVKGKTVNTVLSHIFCDKICFEYAVYIVGRVWFVFNGNI